MLVPCNEPLLFRMLSRFPGGDCGKALIGLPRLRPIEYRRLKQREKRVNRAYGGSRCAGCVRSRGGCSVGVVGGRGKGMEGMGLDILGDLRSVFFDVARV